jgi:putative endonuclease
MDRQQLGKDAEQRAADFLQAAGLQIVVRNYRCRMGELDIVAVSDKALIIAEVRYRSSEDYGGGAASVTARKQLRIVRASQHLLVANPKLARRPVRFDVLVVHADTRPVEWLQGAFVAF